MRLKLVGISMLLALLVPLVTWGQESADAEQELFRMINADRAQAGVPQLEWNEWLAQAARNHAAEMAKRGELSHQFSGEPGMRDRIGATGVRFNAAAENVAFGPTAQEINNDWTHSPPHRTNMLNPKYNAIGVAVVRRGDELYAVTDFAHTVPGQSASDVEDEVAVAINQARAREKLPPLARRMDSGLRSFACQMAKDNRVNAQSLLVRSNVSASLAFTDSDPANFGSHLRDDMRGYHAFAVGACFARNSKYPEGTNWIVVTFD